jgi:8-oxo-dGTP diphosphatase
VTREVLDESGLTIPNPHLQGFLMFPNFKGKDWHVFVFTITDFTGKSIDSPEGKLEWISEEKLLDLYLRQSEHIFMPWLKEGTFFSAKFEYDENQLRGYSVACHSQE